MKKARNYGLFKVWDMLIFDLVEILDYTKHDIHD
jgi:hypothetical protein